MENTSNTGLHRELWQEIWQRKNILKSTVDRGRSVYNLLFKRFLKPYMGKEVRVLELGCGSSSLLLSLAHECKKVTGLDISPSAIENSRKLAHKLGVENVEFVEGDCQKIPLSPEFDVVWSQGLLEHFEDPQLVLCEHVRILKPGGVALISVPHSWSYFRIWYICTRPKSLQRFWPWTEQVFFSRAQLLSLCSQLPTCETSVTFLQPLGSGIIILKIKK